MTALGAAVLLAPLVTFLVGRFHPAMQPAKSSEPASPAETEE